MLEYLKIENVGPAPLLELEMAPRLNLITGDNGLGKTFILDAIWFSSVGSWPAEVNARIGVGRMALPVHAGTATIAARDFGFDNSIRKFSRQYQFWRQAQLWGEVGTPDRPTATFLYAQVDGSFSIWDPSRNSMPSFGLHGHPQIQERPRAYVLAASEVWDGLVAADGTQLCNGLIRDWGSWQKENGAPFKLLFKVLEQLSPDVHEELRPGKLTRVSLDDVRDIPTLRTSYGQDVPVVFAAAGIRRIIALAYLMVWSWEEHKRASELIGREPCKTIIFLIDEIEAHLHPRWQRTLLKSLLTIASALSTEMKVQLITATHSPLVMASAEPWFDRDMDAWFDLDLSRDNGTSHVTLRKRTFEPLGEASDWLTSEAFDLGGAGSLERQKAIEKAALTLSNEQASPQEAREVHEELRRLLPEADPFWMRWRHVGEKRGWWP